MNFLIGNAYAADAMQAQDGGGFSLLVMMMIFIVFMYFMVWRPQSKRAKQQQNLLGSLSKGDEVMTAGGMIGKIVKINDQYISISVSENVELPFQKSSVVSVLPKGTCKSIV